MNGAVKTIISLALIGLCLSYLIVAEPITIEYEAITQEPNTNIPIDGEPLLEAVRNQFNWKLPQYDGWRCVNKSNATYDYLESLGYNLRVCSGYNLTRESGHRWIMIQLDGAWYDFECTSLRFKDVGCKYDEIKIYNNKEQLKWY